MRTTCRLLLAALLLTAGTAAQEAIRRVPQEPDFQQKVDAFFGDAISTLQYYPFYEIAPWLGISTDPKLRRDDRGNPVVESVVLEGHDGEVTLAAFTPSGRRVLTADASHIVRLWSLHVARWKRSDPDTAPDPVLARLAGHTGAITSMAVFPDEAGIAQADVFRNRGEVLTGSRDGTARIWATPKGEDGKAAGPFVQLAVLEHGAPVTRAMYSPAGRWIATAGSDGRVLLWNAACEIAAELGGHQGGIAEMVFHPSGAMLLTRDGTETLRLWTANGQMPAEIKGATDPWAGIGFAADGERIRATTNDGTARYWDLEGRPAEPPEDDGAQSAPLPSVRVEGNRALLTVPARGDNGGDRTYELAGHGGPITVAAFGDNHHRLLTASADGTVRVWEWLVRGPDGNPAVVSVPFVVIWLVLAAVLFTLFMRFVNLRMFKHAIACVRGRFSNPEDQGEVSHFQALSSALSATVGLGNIAGVAIAVSIGGPGATFWMIVAGLLGMTLKFTECTLGQKFRKIDDQGRVSGGPMHYLKDGLRGMGLGAIGVPLALIFTVFCIGGSLAGGNAFQVNQSLGILRGQVPFFDEYDWVYGLIMAFFVGVVIIGGIRRIAQTAEKIVPTMCGIYVLSAIVIIVTHIGHVPEAFGTIVSSALSGDAVYGGAIGALVMGFRRAAFSNEAGVGSAAIAHSAARTPYPVREGIVALLEPFIDTVVVCTMTALVIVITGVYQMPEHAELVAGNDGAALTAEAFKDIPLFASWFPWLLMVAVILFAFSTMISWSYYGERCWTNLFGPRSSLSYKLLFLVFVVLGSVVQATNVLEFGDLMILLMAFPNIFGLYFLAGTVRRELQGYEAMLKNGEIRPYR